MEVSCKPVRGRDVQSLRSSNYLKEKKVKCIRFTVKSYMDLVADRYNSFVNANFWGGWEIDIFSWWLPSIYFHLDKVIFIA